MIKRNVLHNRVIALLIMVFLSTTILVACQRPNVQEETTPAPAPTEQAEKTIIKVGTLKGPTGMGMAELMEKDEKGETKSDYEFMILGSPDDMVGKIVSQEVDVAAVPTNLAAVLYSKTQGNIKLAAVNTLGVLYVLENGDTIHSVKDLQGKTMSSSGKGASPDFVLQYILAGNGLAPEKDVIIDYKLQHAELASALAAGDVSLAMLPQPHVTAAMMQNPDLRIALDITKEWETLQGEGSKLPMGSLIVSKDFAENNPEALQDFLSEYKQSVEFVNANIDEAAALIEKFEILPKAAIAKKAIPLSNIVYYDAAEAKPFLEEFYTVLHGFDPKSVGGQLPDEEFYYQP